MSECTKCGICREECIVARLGGDSITSILNEESAGGAWNCANCMKCVNACPLGVDILALMYEKRRGEEAPAAYREALESVCRGGYIFSMDEVETIREMWGLPPVRLADPAKVRKLLSGCGEVAPAGPDKEETG